MTDNNRQYSVTSYIAEACTLLKNSGEVRIKSFILLYLLAYSHKYNRLKSWPRTIADLNLSQLKVEACNIISENLYSLSHIDDYRNIDLVQWLIQNPPPETREDVLGSIYLVCSNEKHRKRMGEHYTRRDLVDYVIDQTINISKTNLCSIKKMRVLDPACGSGNFIIQILRKRLINNSDSHSEILRQLEMNEFIVGVDIQEIACIISKVRILMELISQGVNFTNRLSLPIYNFDSLLIDHHVVKENSFDIVITNPPYLRYQSIDQGIRKAIKDKYLSCTGRYDLYTIFIEKAIKLTKSNGYTVILCSDMFMTSAYGRGIRDYVQKHASLLLALDLREIQPFEAVVLSSVFFFQKTIKNTMPIFKKLGMQAESTFKSKLVGTIEISDKWRYADSISEKIFVKIKENPETKFLESLCNIFVGIKTTADDIYCKKITNTFAKGNKLEKELIRPLLRGKNIKRWRCEWTGEIENVDTNVIYPYKLVDGKTVPIRLDDYPNIKKYLSRYQKILKSREYFQDSKKQWYELWVPLSHNSFQQIKIITPDISSRVTFFLDEQNFFCNGTIYIITFKDLKEIDEYKYLIGILNSNVIDFFHKNANPNKISSQKFRFQTGTMKHYPIIFKPKECNEYKDLVNIVELIEKSNEENLLELETQLNRIVYSIYSLNQYEIKVIESYLTP